MANETMTVDEAAAYTHVTRQAIYMSITKLHLKAEKQGKFWVIKKADLDAYRVEKYSRDRRKINGELVFDIEKGYFSIAQVSKIIASATGESYHIQRLYYLIRSGQLKALRKGSTWVVQADEANALADRERGIHKNQSELVKYGD